MNPDYKRHKIFFTTVAIFIFGVELNFDYRNIKNFLFCALLWTRNLLQINILRNCILTRHLFTRSVSTVSISSRTRHQPHLAYSALFLPICRLIPDFAATGPDLAGNGPDLVESDLEFAETGISSAISKCGDVVPPRFPCGRFGPSKAPRMGCSGSLFPLRQLATIRSGSLSIN